MGRIGRHVFATVLVLALTACGSTGTGSGATTDPASTAFSAAPSTSAPSSTAPSAAPSSSDPSSSAPTPSTPTAAPSSGAGTALGSGPSTVPSASVSVSLPPGPGVTAQTLTGTIGPGVESGCVVLTADGSVLANLVGLPAAELLAQADDGPVQVRGQFVEGGMSFCQQGRMFQVTEVVSG